MATNATIKHIERSGITLTPAAKEMLLPMYTKLADLPD